MMFLLQGVACKNLWKKSNFQVEFLSEQILKKKLKFAGLPIGGLSALTFDESTGEFLALSDDKLNHRFYKLKIHTSSSSGIQRKKGKWMLPLPAISNQNNPKSSPFFQFIFKKRIPLREKDSQSLSRNMDLEGIALKNQTLFITSEGQQIFNPPEPPQVFAFSKKGVLKKAWPVPAIFWNREKLPSFGTKENKGFEALTLTEKHLWTATEKALRQDPGRFIRLSGFDLKKRQLFYQYPYFLDSKAGLSEMIAITERTFLTLERAYNKKTGENQVRLFTTHCQKATNLMFFLNQPLKYSPDGKSLVPSTISKKTGPSRIKKLKTPGQIIPCHKNLLFDFANLPTGITVDNLEGMTLGPEISTGGQLLVFVSDNNFRLSQKTQFLFFRISPVIKTK